MKSIRTNPRADAPEGDERIRTAVCERGTDPVYEAHDWAAVEPHPHDLCECGRYTIQSWLAKCRGDLADVG